MGLSPQHQLAAYSERFHRELVIPHLLNFDWRPDYENGKGATTNIQVFLPGLTGRGSDIGAIDGRYLNSRNVPATMEQYFSAVSVNSIDQATLVGDFEKAVEPTLAAHVYDIECDLKKAISSAVSSVCVLQPGDSLPDLVGRVIGQIRTGSLESQVNALMSPELMSEMAAKLLEKFNAPAPALEAFEGRIRRWQGASDIGSSIAMDGFTAAADLAPQVHVSAPAGPADALTISVASQQAIPAGTMSINLGRIGYDPVKKATGKDLVVANAQDIPPGGTQFKLSFRLEAGATCSKLPAEGDYPVSEAAGASYGEIYVFRKGAIAGRAGVLPGHSAGKMNFLPKNGGIAIRRWQFSEGQQDVETVRFDALLAAATVYPSGAAKILVPM